MNYTLTRTLLLLVLSVPLALLGRVAGGPAPRPAAPGSFLMTGVLLHYNHGLFDSLRIEIYDGHHKVGEVWTNNGLFSMDLSAIAQGHHVLTVVVRPQKPRWKARGWLRYVSSQPLRVSPGDAQGLNILLQTERNWGAPRIFSRRRHLPSSRYRTPYLHEI